PATPSMTPRPSSWSTCGTRTRDCPSTCPRTTSPMTTTPNRPWCAGAATPTCSTPTGSTISSTRPRPMTSWPSAGASGVSKLFKALEIVPGLTAVVGSGGKTSLIAALARELPGTVIVATSTHIFPAAGLPLVTERVAKLPSPNICMGTPTGEGKLTAPMQPWAELIALADYVLLEADGSKRLPLKAHLPHEPLIPAEANQVISVL